MPGQTPIGALRNSDKSIAELTRLYCSYLEQEKQYWQHLDQQHCSNWADSVELSVAKWPEHIAITEVETGKSYSYLQLNTAANQVAIFISREINESQVGVYLDNSFAFLAIVLGLAKAGKLAILFNPRETLKGVTRLAERSQISTVISQQAIYQLTQIQPELLFREPQAQGFSRQHRCHIKLSDPAAVIFTSGTSGLSKPALFSHKRLIGAGIAWSLRTGMSEQESCYITLPLCHGNGLAVALSAVLTSGGRAVIRKRFSVSNFWQDIRSHQCSSMVYIGELWRYLLNQPAAQDDRQHGLKVLFGNGLNTQLWQQVVARFGVEHIVEHFGATEMPAGALTNWTGRAGYCGFIPQEFNAAEQIRLVDESGNPREQGEALFLIPEGQYRGYLDPSLDKDKLWPDLLTCGDLWWRSGDLLKRTDKHFYSFVDRLGDSYRWKGENVSASEVEAVIRKTGYFEEVVVYGIPVPLQSGKVGMCSLLPKKTVNLDKNLLKRLLSELRQELADYAIPHFIRRSDAEHQVTSTLKITKNTLAKEGISLENTPIFVLSQGQYQTLTKEMFAGLEQGQLPIGFLPGQTKVEQ